MIYFFHFLKRWNLNSQHSPCLSISASKGLVIWIIIKGKNINDQITYSYLELEVPLKELHKASNIITSSLFFEFKQVLVRPNGKETICFEKCVSVGVN